eukprot:COSAG02_NODE_1110_length_14511_cov_30.804122_5_plen_158_part_00
MSTALTVLFKSWGPGQPDHQPLPESRRAHTQGHDGEKHQALSERDGEGVCSPGSRRRVWSQRLRSFGRARLRPRNLHPTGRLFALRRGIPPTSVFHLDHETSTRRTRLRHFLDQQAFTDQEVGDWRSVSSGRLVVCGPHIRGEPLHCGAAPRQQQEI